MTDEERSSLQETIAQALEQMKREQGGQLKASDVNLAELERMTGISRGKLRQIQKNGFVVKPHGNTGKRRGSTVISGYTGVIDRFLEKNVRNSNTIFKKLQDLGYAGGKTQIKNYIQEHKYLLPAKREVVASQGNRGRRYQTGPGEQYQMDWGFVNVDTDTNSSYRTACFAMMCHHCGRRYVEFFPDAKQENLFIGMIHAFQHIGLPEYVLTDNMKSVMNGRDSDGHPLWNHDYEAFMEAVGFKTKLCKPRHPFTKGAVERLIRFVKESFVSGRTFSNITDLNYAALRWCEEQDNSYHACVDCVPSHEHARHCMAVAHDLVMTDEIRRYLLVERKISFDGFINFEGRRFGVPYRYTSKVCRVGRDGYYLYVYSDDLRCLLVKHDVTWSRRDSYCKDQFKEQPEEFPTMPVKVHLHQDSVPEHSSAFDRFNFDREA